MTADITFDGKPRHLDEFILRVKAHIGATRSLKADSRAAAAFIVSKLEGDAIEWAKVAQNKDPGVLRDYDTLLTALKTQFAWSLEAQKSRAAHRIKHCRQGKRSVLSYHLEFTQYANALGWDETTQKTTFQDGLSPQIKKAIVTAGKQFNSLDELAKEAGRLDTELFAAGGAFGGLSMGRNSGRRAGGGFNGKCHTCGKFGHKSANCRGKRGSA